jgi:glycosyltransferase involved in cell wall biosynthesis
MPGSDPSPPMPRLSVVIPSLAREDRLRTTLCELARQRYPEWECIVVLQSMPGAGARDALQRTLGERLRLFFLDQPNASLARNIGLIEATGDIVLFLDDDVLLPEPEFLARHARHYADPNLCAVSGQVRGRDRAARPTCHPWSLNPRYGWLYFPPNHTQPRRLSNGTSANLSIRRDWAIAVGGMDAQFEKGAHREESDFCLRLTHQYGPLLFDPEAWLVHLGEPTGGCRHWGMNRGLMPLHHVTGEWYFIAKSWRERRLGVLELAHHLLALARRQIFNPANRARPTRMLAATRRSFEGWRLARRKLRQGSRDLSAVPAPGYMRL